jgi:hypothetical protein
VVLLFYWNLLSLEKSVFIKQWIVVPQFGVDPFKVFIYLFIYLLQMQDYGLDKIPVPHVNLSSGTKVHHVRNLFSNV